MPTRDTIRVAAAQLFAHKGFAATTTREICLAAGVTKPVLYYHFGNKAQLYRELIIDACNETRKQMLLASQKGKTGRDKLIEALAADFALTRRSPALSRLFFRMLFAPEKDSPGLDLVEMGLEFLRMVGGIVAEGVRQGELKGRAREIGEALMGIHTLYTMSYLLTRKPVLGRPLARRVVDLLLRGCQKKPTDR